MQCELIVTAGPETGRRFALEDGQTLSIGRGQASDTKLNDPRMSRIHCRVQVDGDATWLLDAGGSGGTLVAGNPVEKHGLCPGETFRVGDTEMRYQLEGALEANTMVGGVQVAAPPRVGKPPAMQDLLGETIHGFRLDAIITTGQSGMIFKGHQLENDRAVAVKVLTPDLTNNDEQKERFVRAMKTMLPIRHPNLVELYNAGKKGPFCWAAMEYVDGESMTDVIERIGVSGMLDWREVWRVAVHIGRGLDEAYRHKVIHRNVTPTNIMRRHSDKVCKLGDLMLAKALDGTLAKQVTQPGQLIGDVPYMSPERTRDGSGIDGRSDLYGLGATLYALLTGKPPFEATALPDLIRQVRDAEPKPPREFQLSINEKFQDAVMQLIRKDPADRYQSPADLLKDMDHIGRFNSLSAD